MKTTMKEYLFVFFAIAIFFSCSNNSKTNAKYAGLVVLKKTCNGFVIYKNDADTSIIKDQIHIFIELHFNNDQIKMYIDDSLIFSKKVKTIAKVGYTGETIEISNKFQSKTLKVVMNDSKCVETRLDFRYYRLNIMYIDERLKLEYSNITGLYD